MKKIVPLFFGLFIIFATFIACSSTDSNSSSVTGTNNTSSSEDNKEQTASNQKYKIGDVVNVGDVWEVTVHKIYSSGGADFITPEAGKTFILVDVAVKNISDKEQNISSLLHFTLKDGEGRKGDFALFNDGTPAPDGKVAAGDVLRGNLSYQFAEDQTNFTLAFQADIISSGQALWELSL